MRAFTLALAWLAKADGVAMGYQPGSPEFIAYTERTTATREIQKNCARIAGIAVGIICLVIWATLKGYI